MNNFLELYTELINYDQSFKKKGARSRKIFETVKLFSKIKQSRSLATKKWLFKDNEKLCWFKDWWKTVCKSI